MFQTARSECDAGTIATATPNAYLAEKIRRFRISGNALPGSDTCCRARSIPTLRRWLVDHAIAAPTAAVTNQSAIRIGEDIDCSANEVTPHPIKIAGVIRSRHIGRVRGLNAWKPSHISRAKSANTHQGVF